MMDYQRMNSFYGNPGIPTYDTERKEWIFPNIEGALLKQEFRRIKPFEMIIAPSLQSIPAEKNVPSVVARSQMKWLLKSYPETFPGNDISAYLVKHSAVPDSSTQPGTIMALGKAVDTNRLSGQFLPRIMALPCDEAGHVLRLTRLRVHRYKSQRLNVPKISLVNPDINDQGFWTNSRGPILQTVFSKAENSSSTWLAVRQSSAITIFRPFIGRVQRAAVPANSAKKYPPSRLSSNPVAVLSAEQSGSQNPVDVTFNPWYARQLAVVDSSGSWSLWEVEGPQSRHSPQRLAAGKGGHILDGRKDEPYSTSSSKKWIDPWHQILWVCDINTIVVCNRRHVAVFDITTRPQRLRSIDFAAAATKDWILDIKRSPGSNSHLFVLTTTRILWLNVEPDQERRNMQPGAKVLLAYQHFRDPNDHTMKLTTVEDDKVSVLVSSSRSPLIHVYGFSIHSGTTSVPIAWQSSFQLSPRLDGLAGSLQTLCFLPSPMSSGSLGKPETPTDTGTFFQVFALTSDLALSSALCLAQSPTAPGESSTRSGTMSSDKKPLEATYHPRAKMWTFTRNPKDCWQDIIQPPKAEDDLHLSLDWRDIFKHIFLQVPPKDSDESSTMQELLTGLSTRLQDAKDQDSLPTSTLLELCGAAGISEELDLATSTLRTHLESLIQDHESPSTIVISDLTTGPSITLPSGQQTTLPDMFAVYDDLVDAWMTKLPPGVPRKTRVSMHKIIRRVTIELSLSSIGLSRQPKEPEQPEAADEHGAVPSSSIRTPEMTPAPISEPSSNMPSPPRTPSVSSNTTSTTRSQLGENPAITRLRKYAVSIASQPDPGPSKLLSSWNVGGDPADYKWEDSEKVVGSGEEGSRKRRREDARRKKRTEKFLRRERARAPVAAESQPAFLPAGSQPDFGHNGFSSQTVDDMPMTQPEIGAFGSRTATKGKKKPKRRKSGF